MNCLSKNERDAFQSGLQAYFQKYRCSVHDQILVEKAKNGDWVKLLPDGSKESTLAVSSPGRIELVPASLTSTSRDQMLKDLMNSGLHEATHACKPKEKLIFEKPFMLPEGTTVLGVHGFNVIVRLSNGQETGFGLIEEGIAEMLAFKAHSSYSVTSSKYANLGSLSIKLLNCLEVSPEEIQDHLEKNDLWWFINRILGRDLQNREPKDFIRVMDAFQKAADGTLSPSAIVKLLINKMKGSGR